MSGEHPHPRLAHEDPPADNRPRATVTIARRPLWRIRLARGLPRYVLYALALAGALASARFAVDPPRAALASLPRQSAGENFAAEGFATLFARAYLTWEAQHPEARERALAPFVGSGIDADAGLQPPPGSARSQVEQRVQWTQVVQQRSPLPDETVYTVAAQTDTSGLLYLTVSVLHKPGSPLALAGYPAFVGPPASGAAQTDAGERLREVNEAGLSTVVERALRNYLAGSPSELAADLASGARVSLPGIELALQSLQTLQWAPGAGAVLALVQAQDQRGTQYTLAYELDVLRAQGRWEISAIQMDPDSE
jgi:Conjugative transposon protein TcpC